MRILLIEDDAIMQLQFGEYLRNFGKVTIASNRSEAEEILKSQYFEIGFFDLDLGEDRNAGLNLLKLAPNKVQKRYLLTSNDDQEIVKTSFELKANGFFSKNCEYAQLRKEIEFVLIQTKWDQHQKEFYANFPTQDISLKNQIDTILKNPAIFNLNLLLTGETGTGKTYLVKQLCQILFPNKKLFNLNLSEIPQNLLESELFGHAEGSFTGAHKKRTGLLEEAHGHIVFLDEIATLPVEIQGRLLKVLEEKRFRPIGSNQVVQSQFILISATCENIKDKMKSNQFREDLYFRLNGYHLHLPSLNKRKSDIPLIAKAWMSQSLRKINLSHSLLEKLSQKQWQGNTRELIHYLKQICYLGPTEIQIEKPENQNIDEYQEQEIRNNGLRGYISKLEQNIFRTYAHKNNYKVNQICRDLKISKAVYYRLAKS